MKEPNWEMHERARAIADQKLFESGEKNTDEDESLYADADMQERLIDACNLICEYVADKLPEQWQIVVTTTQGESFVELFDADSELVEYAPKPGISIIDEMCVTAIRREGKS